MPNPNASGWNYNDIARLANSPAGKQLLDILSKSDGNVLNKALKQASAGNTQGAKDALQDILADQRIQTLLHQMKQNNG